MDNAKGLVVFEPVLDPVGHGGTLLCKLSQQHFDDSSTAGLTSQSGCSAYRNNGTYILYSAAARSSTLHIFYCYQQTPRKLVLVLLSVFSGH